MNDFANEFLESPCEGLKDSMRINAEVGLAGKLTNLYQILSRLLSPSFHCSTNRCHFIGIQW